MHRFLFFLLPVLFPSCGHVIIEDYLGSQLTMYDLIDSKRIISKRSLGYDAKSIEITAFNRTFSLILAPMQSQSVSNTFSVTIADPVTGIFTAVNTSSLLDDFFSGQINGESDSKVTGYFANNKLICTIWTNGSILNIEPVSTLTGNVSDNRLLAYYDYHMRNSETGVSDSHWCGLEDANSGTQQLPSNPSSSSSSSSSNRTRRQRRSPQPPASENQMVCSLQVVADHAFFDRIGMSQLGATVRGIVKLIDDVNAIYHATQLSDAASGKPFPTVGFELSSVLVMSAASSTPRHFNAPSKESQHKPSDLLEAFGDEDQTGFNYSAHCLNHLLTFRRMERNVLGLAYLNGMCRAKSFSAPSRKDGVAQNTGFTTFSDQHGFPLLQRRATLVTVHELGHNLGSSHDSPACMPDAQSGGYYVMHSKSVTGQARNNEKFSPCSVQQMSAYIAQHFLNTKQHGKSCLSPPNPRLCGNHRLDPGEQCDSGAAGDACCSGQCLLRTGATCSDAQQGCCQGCKVAAKGALCSAGRSLLAPCHGPAQCNGTSADCPLPLPALPDGDPCNSGVGRCLGGRCVSACYPAQPCVCRDTPCQLCCITAAAAAATANGSSCALHARSDGGPVAMPAETPCPGDRRCDGNGSCVPASYFDSNSGRPAARMLDSTRHPGGGSFGTNNLVFIVLAVTLLLWVPICLIWSYRTKLSTANADGAENEADITFNVST